MLVMKKSLQHTNIHVSNKQKLMMVAVLVKQGLKKTTINY